MDNAKARKSDVAATRKRRSSILKSQRAPRAPFSELEFNVATPQAESKSRRVSFSRRTGVAEFEINEATTAWKNVYEEHNKSLETSGNEAGGARPRRVQHLGARADMFQDAEAELVPELDAPQADLLPELHAPQAELELSQLTERRTADVFRLVADAPRPHTDILDVDFSAVAPLVDDLDALQRDLDAGPPRGDMSEYNIDVDFNATHFTLKAEDSDDMSITDSIPSPRLAAAGPRTPAWADKENIVMNPYVAPPSADFACDDILVFDGKKCKFQSNLDDEVKPAGHRRTIVEDRSLVMSDARASKTVFFDDVADMTVTQAVPAQILQPDARLAADPERVLIGKEPRRQTIVYANEDADISVTQALPAQIIAPLQIACDDSIVPEKAGSKTEKQKTMYFDDMADISVTQTLPANIIQHETERSKDVAVKQTAPTLSQSMRATLPADDVVHTDRMKTIVYGNDDGDLSVTAALPANILDKKENPNLSNMGRRSTIVYRNDICDVTAAAPVSIADKEGQPAPSENARRRTIVYGNDDGNISMTGVVPANIMVRNETNLAQPLSTHRRKTIVYGNDDGNVSMTGVVPANIMVNREEADLAETLSTNRRKTIVYGNDDGNISMTGVVPANIMINKEENVAEPLSTGRRKTIVYGNDDGNISMTGVIPANIMVNREEANLAETLNTNRRKTIVYGNDDGNISMTGVVPANIMTNKEANVAEPLRTGRRKTIVYGNDDGNISMTGVIPANIMVNREEANLAETLNTNRRKTIVYGNDDGNISMTGVVPAGIIVDEGTELTKDVTERNTTDRRKTIVYLHDEGNISVTGVVPAIIVDKQTLPSSERRKTIVYGNDDGDISMTGVVPANIMDKDVASVANPERRRTVVYGSDDVDVSASDAPGRVTADELVEALHAERRTTTVYGNDEDVSMTGVVPANLIVDGGVSVNQSRVDSEKTSLVDGHVAVLQDDRPEDKEAADLPRPATDRTIVDQNDDNSITKVTSNVMDEGEFNEDQPIHAECREASVCGKDLSMAGVLVASATLDGGESESEPILTECKKTMDEDEGGDMSPMHIELSKTIGNDGENVSMATVPDVVKEADTNTERGETDDINMSMTEMGPRYEDENVDAIEIITDTIDYREEGDVSMADVDTRSRGGPQTQPSEDMCEDKNDQVSMTVTRSPSAKSHDESVETSGVGRQSPNNLTYGDFSYAKNMSTFQKSPGVVVYEATTRGELGQIHGGRLSTYGRDLAPQKSPVSPEDDLSLTSNRASMIDAHRKTGDFEDTSASDAFSRRLSANLTEAPGDTTLERSRTKDRSSLGGGRMALDGLSRSPAPDRALLLEALSPTAVRSPPVSVLDALLDMSPMDDQLGAGLPEATVERDLSCLSVRDSDDEPIDDEDHMRPSEDHQTGDGHIEYKDRAVSCESPKTDARVETDDMERDEGNQTHWATSCVGTQPDDTREILDALDRFTDTRRSMDGPPPRRSIAPDRRSMVRSREDLLKDISMAQALMKTEMEQEPPELEDPETEPSPPRVSRASGEVVKTLRFEDDSVRESPKILHKPVASPAAETRRASVIPPYLLHVGEVKDLMEDLVKPPDETPARDSLRHSEIQTDALPSSQIDLTDASRPGGGAERAGPAARAREGAVLVFDVDNPLNNVALPARGPRLASPTRHSPAHTQSRGSGRDGSPPRGASPAHSPSHSHSPPHSLSHSHSRHSHSPSRSHSPSHSQSTAVFAAHASPSPLKQRASPASSTTPMDASPTAPRSPQRVGFRPSSGSGAGSEDERGAEPRKRTYSPADPPYHQLTPKPAVKVQKVSPASKVCRAASPRRASPDSRDLSVQQLLSEVQLTDGAESGGSGGEPRAGGDVINQISMLPFMGAECWWESCGDTWWFRLLSGRLRLEARLAHRVQRAAADTPVLRAQVHLHHHHDGDPVSRWCVRLAAAALQRVACGVRRAGHVPHALRRATRVCRAARRWARDMQHARLQLAYSLDDDGEITLKVANIALRSVWEVRLRVECEEGGEGARVEGARAVSVLGGWAPAGRDLAALLAPLPRGWPHVPRAIWEIFRYLKNKRLDDELLLGAA